MGLEHKQFATDPLEPLPQDLNNKRYRASGNREMAGWCKLDARRMFTRGWGNDCEHSPKHLCREYHSEVQHKTSVVQETRVILFALLRNGMMLDHRMVHYGYH